MTETISHVDGQAVRERVIERLLERFEEAATILRGQQQQTLLTFGGLIVPALVNAHAVLFRSGLHPALDLKVPLISICAQGASLLTPFADQDEAAKAAQLTYEAVGELITAASASAPSATDLVSAGIVFGRADVRLTQVITGLWEIMAAADVNASLAAAEATRRKNGGKKTAASLKGKAAAWKERLLPVAQKLDRANPDWNRQKLAVEIIYDTDEKEVGLRAVEDWLRLEAEPHGLVGSRARKQSAKQPSQVS